MRPHAAPLSGDFSEVDLTDEIARLRREAEATPTGHNAKTLMKYPSLRVVLIAMREASRIPGHETDGRITIHTITGHIRVHAAGRVFDLPAGRLLALDQSVRHELEAQAESAFLLTIAWPEGVAGQHIADTP